MNWLKNEESGQGMVEYGLIIVVIATVLFLGFKFFGGEINTWFGGVADNLPTN